MSKNITIQTKLVMSKSFPPGIAGLRFGRYEIKPIPSASPNDSEAILEFADLYESPNGGGSNPEEEANIVCSLLSVVLETRMRRSGLRVNAIDISSQSRIYVRFCGNIETKGIDTYLQCILHLPIDLARQLSRSCRAYASALEYIPSDATFAFFLLVVSVECLSSQAAIIPESELDLDSKKCERFCTFIHRYFPDGERTDDERNETLFRELLKTVYYSHRSAFVHGGKEVSAAALMADTVGSSYFKHATEGQETRTPGLDWFARIVRGAIMGYLNTVSLAGTTPNEHLLAELALEKAMLRLKAKRDIKQWEAVTSSDIEYR